MKLHPSAYAIALACVAVHEAVSHRFGFYRDELYFIDCARHLAWGYVDQPPLAPFVTWLAAPLHYPVWGVRFFPALLSGVTILLACAIAAEFGGGAFAQADRITNIRIILSLISAFRPSGSVSTVHSLDLPLRFALL